MRSCADRCQGASEQVPSVGEAREGRPVRQALAVLDGPRAGGLSDDDDREERPEAHYKVQVSLGQDDIDSPLATLSAGDLVGEMSLMTGEPRKATCRAATDVLCYELDHATLQSVLTTRPAIADQMSALLAARQGDLERKGGELSAQSAARGTDSRGALVEKIRRFFNLS